MTTQFLSVLGDVFNRAGASDKDREQWLEERRNGITATEVRDLTVKGDSFRRELLAIKRGESVSAFVGNQYTDWGNKREPQIAEWVKLRYSLVNPESRVFHHATESRFLASPDGIGVVEFSTHGDDFVAELIVTEIKTSKHDISPGTDNYLRSGYFFQMQWSMFVTGAQRCLYVWEQHDNNWPEPAPLEMEPNSAWIARDEEVIHELVKTAEAFLAQLESGVADEADDYRELLTEWAAADRKEKAAKARKVELSEKIRALIGDRPKFSLAVAGLPSIQFFEQKAAARFDTTAFKAAHPALAAEFTVASGGSTQILKIIPAKEISE